MIHSVSHNLSVRNMAIVGNEFRNRHDPASASTSPAKLTLKVLQGSEHSTPLHSTRPVPLTGSEQVGQLLGEIRQVLKDQEVELQIEMSMDKELKQVIIRVVDKETGDLEKQIPPEDLLKLKRFFNEHAGLFVEEEA